VSRLVVVSGAPGSGKTRLARWLADETGWPALKKDSIKEALADAIGLPSDLDASRRLGIGSYAALFAMATAMVSDGVDVILESNFRRGLSEKELKRVAAAASDARLIHCAASPDVVTARYRRRFDAGSRHGAHLDDLRLPALSQDLDEGRYRPLDLLWPSLVVNTESGYAPGLPDILSFATDQLGTARRNPVKRTTQPTQSARG
jgi:predicted kinase